MNEPMHMYDYGIVKWQCNVTKRDQTLVFYNFNSLLLIDLVHVSEWSWESITKWNGHDAMLEMKAHWD